MTISWQLEQAEDLADLQLELSTDGGRTYRVLAARLDPQVRNYSWHVSISLDGSRYRVRLSALDHSGNEGIDAGDSDFRIVPLDADQDGLPDHFETAHGFDPNTAGEDILDSDGDGMSNLQEYLAGTDPLESASFLGVHRVEFTPAGLNIHFLTGEGRLYIVERSDDLRQQAWVAVGDPVAGTGSVVVVSDLTPPATSQCFYRVRLW